MSERFNFVNNRKTALASAMAMLILGTLVGVSAQSARIVPWINQPAAGAAWCAVRKYALTCGLPAVKPHDFRRFVGTQLAKRDIRQAQKALGHKRLETTAQHYMLDELQVGLTDGFY
jgi:integrase